MSEFRPLIIIPTYNTGSQLLKKTVKAALETGLQLLLVVDGSTDGSADNLDSSVGYPERLQIIRKSKNTGKGDAMRIAVAAALKKEFTHALVMDSDGQHPSESIKPMLERSRKNPSAIIMGQPIFGKEAPVARIYGRKLTSFWTNIETLWCGLGDTLFGMRVYPLKPFRLAFEQTSFARGFDFDPEIAVRMTWLGCQPLPHPVPVRYLHADEGGVSHFHYLRDNFKLTLLHFRLVPELILFRLNRFLRHKRQWKSTDLSS
jgi:glycosyltransferase involved in cell wall biosynthesis